MIGAYVQLARPAQWVKNLAVFAGPAFGLRLFDATWFPQALLAFAAFCLVSSASYAINDVMDREADARHPSKKNRPVARGVIHPVAALIFGGLLVVGGVGLSAVVLPRATTLLVAVYFVLILCYSLALKNRVLLDVIVIAIGFVLRAWAGAEAVDVFVSPWLIICTFMICMFMGFGKRRCELAVLGNAEEAHQHRKTLVRYTPELLNHLISVTAGIAIITFVLYTMIKGDHPPPFPKEHLLYTLPLVVYGVFRYAMLTESGKLPGPTEILLKDRAFLATVVLWSLIAIGVVYEERIRGWLDW
ncbi:MAG: decaprenyl-phosphate phosphoribosyltransferase [bacterium]|nr:decaprenyl-phosphate phosphoribosyltransferase [bacterium]